MQVGQFSLGKHSERILKALYEIYPNCCGYNQLRIRAGVHKKVLTLRLSSPTLLRPLSLVSQGLVKLEKGRTPNSPWRITLTEKGRRVYIEQIGGKIEDAIRLVVDLPEEKMREALREVMKRTFANLFGVTRNLANLKKLDSFLKALEEPYMDVANKPLRGTRMDPPSQPFCNARFTLDRIPCVWLRYDAILAIKMGHWLSPGRLRLLETFGIRTNMFLLRHNLRWLKRIQRLGRDPDIEKDLEYDVRRPLVEKIHQEAFGKHATTLWNDLKYF